MNTNDKINKKVEEAIKLTDYIGEVSVSEDFSGKVLSTLFDKPTKIEKVSWFSTPLQVAAVGLILLINGYAIKQKLADNYSESINNFAKTYQMDSDATTLNIQ